MAHKWCMCTILTLQWRYVQLTHTFVCLWEADEGLYRAHAKRGVDLVGVSHVLWPSSKTSLWQVKSCHWRHHVSDLGGKMCLAVTSQQCRMILTLQNVIKLKNDTDFTQ